MILDRDLYKRENSMVTPEIPDETTEKTEKHKSKKETSHEVRKNERDMWLAQPNLSLWWRGCWPRKPPLIHSQCNGIWRRYFSM